LQLKSASLLKIARSSVTQDQQSHGATDIVPCTQAWGSSIMTARFVVYCPGLYDVRNDTGKRFALESDAARFVQEQRKAGRMAWLETEHGPECLMTTGEDNVGAGGRL
jgi:hypothetical protein